MGSGFCVILWKFMSLQVPRIHLKSDDIAHACAFRLARKADRFYYGKAFACYKYK